MIKNFQCVNISSKDPKALADFYTAIDPPRTAGWGGRELTFRDPDGNIVLIL